MGRIPSAALGFFLFKIVLSEELNVFNPSQWEIEVFNKFTLPVRDAIVQRNFGRRGFKNRI